MKVEIIKSGIRDGQTGKEFKVGQKVDFEEARAKYAIEREIAIEVKSTKKKSQQKKVEDSLEKK